MDAQESPDRARGRRLQHDDSAFAPDSDDQQARHYNWVQVCLISAMGLAVGVMGTAAYIIWFSRDQQAYADAMQAARRPPPNFIMSRSAADLAVPAHAAVPTSAVTGRVTPALPSSQRRGLAANAALDSDQSSDDDAAIADASDDPPHNARPAASGAANNSVRADRSKQAAASRHPPQRAKPKETLASRLTAMFRKIGFHRRGREPGSNPDPYSHP
ncbi:hypothetical protein J8I87_08580 [Paraburkholderia sp. LEh10]|uniref:hypothetical protein n=1 Tax=Paraburkholderia sp. LEh10 TaxID=2821353 RepID=UPI001AE9B4D9|nr:hypothetical protein [Paraburkholderia sp. LEh10]MBP0589770.1 hypothetical protein [Paraburkholderia sp. LEh10]